jgi:hypothetical protein
MTPDRSDDVDHVGCVRALLEDVVAHVPRAPDDSTLPCVQRAVRRELRGRDPADFDAIH